MNRMEAMEARIVALEERVKFLEVKLYGEEVSEFAQDGDVIRIVNAYIGEPYKKGDTFIVEVAYGDGDVLTTCGNHILEWEYEVVARGHH